MIFKISQLLWSLLVLILIQCKSHPTRSTQVMDSTVKDVEVQPLLAQAIRLKEALSFLGSSLSSADEKRLMALQKLSPSPVVSQQIQEILDPYCLAIVDINPESRVKVTRGPAHARLIQGGWVSFLVKVNNEAGINAQLEVESPNSATPLYAPTQDPKVAEEKKLSSGEVANRFLELQIYRRSPLLPNLSGLGLEYAVLQIYCKDAGRREANLGFNIGQGTQDIGFRNAIPVLFESSPSVDVTLHIQDEDGSPTMASFLITDGKERLFDDSVQTIKKAGFRLAAAHQGMKPYYNASDGQNITGTLTGIYPLPSRRIAAFDRYPDFFFQPQVYRADGEDIQLPPGQYDVIFTRGPEYLAQKVRLKIPAGAKKYTANFKLKRWIHMMKLGWYSSDHHVHAAGCSHYESPKEGVNPADMWRQAQGEDLNVSAVLAWGPSWYHQKTFFTGQDDTMSSAKSIMHYDVEVSGFPSSHAGHIVLLRLKEDDYPGTTLIEEWPSWTLPVLKWAKAQQGATGYAHSGWGLQPITATNDLPNYVMPKMDGIGANEYVVTVTQNAIDFYSAGDTPAPWELNMWYHSLNCGFTVRLSGETDFPCIYDERVGLARSYFKPDSALSYDQYVEALKKGRSYISNGSAHIIDFIANGTEVGTRGSKVTINGNQTINISANVAANLSKNQDENGAEIAKSDLTIQPYWHIERARIGNSRKVPVELIVNSLPVDTLEIEADGAWQNIRFSYPISTSAWIALRIYPVAHTNPIFVHQDGKPIVVKKSAEWCRAAVDQCWKMKQSKFKAEERNEALAAYDRARAIYDQMIK